MLDMRPRSIQKGMICRREVQAVEGFLDEIAAIRIRRQ